MAASSPSELNPTAQRASIIPADQKRGSMVSDEAAGERAPVLQTTFKKMGSMESVTDGDEPLDSWATAHLRTISTEGHVTPPKRPPPYHWWLNRVFTVPGGLNRASFVPGKAVVGQLHSAATCN